MYIPLKPIAHGPRRASEARRTLCCDLLQRLWFRAVEAGFRLSETGPVRNGIGEEKGVQLLNRATGERFLARSSGPADVIRVVEIRRADQSVVGGCRVGAFGGRAIPAD